jgi:hypothetical protein
MIYQAQDKNNSRLNSQRMSQFCRFLNEGGLKELHLRGHLITWSNECLHSTLKRIDRAFITTDWECIYSHYDLQSLSSPCSNHAPLLLRTDNVIKHRHIFHFQAFWPRFPGFLDVVQRVWHCLLNDVSPFSRLDCCFGTPPTS